MKTWPALGTTIALFFYCFRAEASELRVSIHGVASTSGTLNVGLYDSEGHFQTAIANAGKLGLLIDRSRLVGIAMRAIAGTQSVVFTNLEPGAYAVIAFHDENDNGKLDKNLFGIPAEAYGFSNDAEGFLAAPSFKDAAVVLDSQDREIAITLKYPRSQSRDEKRN